MKEHSFEKQKYIDSEDDELTIDVIKTRRERLLWTHFLFNE